MILLEKLFSDTSFDDVQFSESFLRHVPKSVIQSDIVDIKQDYGNLVHIENFDEDFVLCFDKAQILAKISLDTNGHIASLWFDAPRPYGNIDDHVASLAALPGDISLLVVSDNKEIAAHNPDMPLAVGSTFKLAVLLAIKNAVERGHLSWNDVVELKPEWTSVPSGILQTWPANTPVTVATLAHLMISISDNTATDALIHIVGREQVEALSPRNSPFPTTREITTLKTKENAERRENWTQGDKETRMAILDQIQHMSLQPFNEAVITHSVEWFMTAREIRELLEATSELPSVSINPGFAKPSDWQKVCHKGGSEPGVINLSTRLEGRDGRVHFVIVTWNRDEMIDESKIIPAYSSLIDAIGNADFE